MVYGRSKLEDLSPEVREAFLRAERDLVQLSFDVFITEGYRPILRQLAYFGQGRLSPKELNELRQAAGLPLLEDSGQIVTYADGISRRSKHQDGRALDVVPYEAETGKLLWNAPQGIWLELGQIAKQYGFAWGGDWKTHPAAVLGWDCPHWEM